MYAHWNCSHVKTFAFSVEGISARAENSSLSHVEEKSHTCSLTLYFSPPLLSRVSKTNFLISHFTIQVLHFVPFIPVQHH